MKSTARAVSRFTVGSGAIALLASCGVESPSASYAPTVGVSPTPSVNVTASPVDAAQPPAAASYSAPRPNAGPAEVDQDVLITPSRMGPVEAGMNLGQIKQTLGDKAQYKTIENLMVDFSGIEVSYDGELQFYLIYYAGDPISDGYEIPMVWVENPKFQTADGVGPGSSLAQASNAYGTATLSYSLEDEMREYVNFDRGPDNLLFRSGPRDEGEMFAGIYKETPETSDSVYFKTQQYREDGEIAAIIVPLERVTSP
ncbi:MAG: hypothetical protein AAGA67_00775 [Cyanobacteria bacterium P01_F01_bin.153]